MTDPTPITCPRRMSDWGPWERVEGLDSYAAGHGLVGQSSGCSFCGSLPPDEFMARVRDDGWIVEPTDKAYKLYLARPFSPEEREERWQRWLRTSGVAYAIRTLGERDGHTDAQVAETLAQEYRTLGDGGSSGVTVAKFYTSHLSPEQGREFRTLWNTDRLRWGYPGHPYRPLYLPGLA